MSARAPRNVVASVRDRLRVLAQQQHEDFNFTLMRYANERFLYRLSQSEHRRDFVLKGAMLLPLWGGGIARPTRDIDLLGFGDPAMERLGQVFGEIAGVSVEPDGMAYDASQIRVEPIQGTQEYGGLRVRVPANLGNIPLPVQIDVGFGDAIIPFPVEAEYPTLLNLPAPVLRMYPLETVVAEKFEAMVRFALANTRLKDYYDLWSLVKTQSFDGALLAEAIAATFVRRGTQIPVTTPSGLAPGFFADPARQRQWSSFLKRVTSAEPPTELRVIVEKLADFLMPPATAAAGADRRFRSRWDPESGWH